MKKSPDNPALLTRYLLGDLSKTEQERLEEEFFIDNDLFIELLDTEDQLVSDYLSDSLSTEDRDRFERRFLTFPDIRRNVEVACYLQSPSNQILTETIEPPKNGGVSWPQFFLSLLRSHQPAAAGLAMAFLLIVGILGFQKMIQISSEKSQPNISRTSPPIATTGSAMLSLTLKKGRFRDSGVSQKVIVGPETQVMELRLESGPDIYSSYQATLQRVGDGAAEVLTEDALDSEKTGNGLVIVVLKLPVNKAPEGDYQIRLSGIGADKKKSSIGVFHFEVRER